MWLWKKKLSQNIWIWEAPLTATPLIVYSDYKLFFLVRDIIPPDFQRFHKKVTTFCPEVLISYFYCRPLYIFIRLKQWYFSQKPKQYFPLTINFQKHCTILLSIEIATIGENRLLSCIKVFIININPVRLL